MVNLRTEKRDYVLNRQKSLHKKKLACNRPFMKIIPKDGGKQIKIECSAGCFELLKAQLLDMDNLKPLFDKYNLAAELKQVTDQNGIFPEYTLRAFNRLAMGRTGKKLKFSVHIYNTQCSFLINGRNASIFQDDILPDILELIQLNPNLTHIDSEIAQLIETCIQHSVANPTTNTSVVADTSGLGNQVSIKMLPNIMKSNESDDESDENSICSECITYVSEGIRCDDCHQWYHYSCERVDPDLMDFHDKEQPYQCIS